MASEGKATVRLLMIATILQAHLHEVASQGRPGLLDMTLQWTNSDRGQNHLRVRRAVTTEIPTTDSATTATTTTQSFTTTPSTTTMTGITTTATATTQSFTTTPSTTTMTGITTTATASTQSVATDTITTGSATTTTESTTSATTTPDTAIITTDTTTDSTTTATTTESTTTSTESVAITTTSTESPTTTTESPTTSTESPTTTTESTTTSTKSPTTTTESTTTSTKSPTTTTESTTTSTKSPTTTTESTTTSTKSPTTTTESTTTSTESPTTTTESTTTTTESPTTTTDAITTATTDNTNISTAMMNTTAATTTTVTTTVSATTTAATVRSTAGPVRVTEHSDLAELVVPPRTTTSPVVHVLTFALRIDKIFDFSSDKKELKMRLEKTIDSTYRSVPGYLTTNVTGFRPGSVKVDFQITATSDILDLAPANQNLANNLVAEGLNVSSSSIVRREQGGLYRSDTLYPGENLMLTCQVPEEEEEKLSVTWSKDDKVLTNSRFQPSFTLTNVTPEDSGEYECTSTWNSMPYVVWQRITVMPYINMQTSADKMVNCDNATVLLHCCAQEGYSVYWRTGDGIPCDIYSASTLTLARAQTGCISASCDIDQMACHAGGTQLQVTCQAWRWSSESTYDSKTITINATNRALSCNDGTFGAGTEQDRRRVDCGTDMVGYQEAQCKSGIWVPSENNCVLRVVQNLKDVAMNLMPIDLPGFVENLRDVSKTHAPKITTSTGTILTIVEILQKIAKVAQTVLINEDLMLGFLQTVDVTGSKDAQEAWVNLNQNTTNRNASSELLRSVEDFGHQLSNKTFANATNSIFIERINVTGSGSFGENLSTQINISQTSGQATIIVFSNFANVLPVRTNADAVQNDTKINGDVVLVQANSKLNNISLSYATKHETLGNPKCVFWNFDLLDGIGGWDSTGCELKESRNKRFTCECNHTTPFSILMSPFTLNTEQWNVLSYITFIGVGISMTCLILCLIIETLVWKSVRRNATSHLHHVSIVNIALSLLIADIWFIVGGAVNKKYANVCSAATFFIHFFYLALFFWMLVSALLLLYRTNTIVSRISRSTMMAVAFSVGYGAPLLIAVVTVASTFGNKKYTEEGFSCWLNWSKTKALLAFVIPALTIVVINLLVLIVVLCKTLKSGANRSAQPQEKHALQVIIKCVGVLTPLFGLTWGFGIGTMVSRNFGIHVVFAFLNSLQGFFVLVFVLLLHDKVRDALSNRLALGDFGSSHTTNTSGGQSSSGLPLFQRLQQKVNNVL